MGKRILVADDSRTIQQAFAMVMDGSGYTLSFARSVDEALSAARRDGRPDLVLSDAVLGTGSGYDLCAQLKADPSLRDVPVYILASVHTPYDEARGRKVGADGHLAKPFESQALLDAVSSVLATPAPQPVASSTASRYDDVIEDEDSYGEITIERGPAQPPAQVPVAAGWAARPARPSVARPVATPAPSASSAAARAPMIGMPRPSPAAPAARPATPPIPSLPAPSQPRHTVMGFPSVRPPLGKPAAPAAPPVAAPAAAAPSRPATLFPPTTAPVRPPVLASPVPAAVPVVARPAPAIPTVPGPVPPPRPVAPRVPPPHLPAAEPGLAASPLLRRPLTPPAPAVPVETPVVPTLAAAVDKIDQKIAALAARGPEFEAIAKLSREIIEQVVWEVVPELAEAIIRREIDRLASAKK